MKKASRAVEVAEEALAASPVVVEVTSTQPTLMTSSSELMRSGS